MRQVTGKDRERQTRKCMRGKREEMVMYQMRVCELGKSETFLYTKVLDDRSVLHETETGEPGQVSG